MKCVSFTNVSIILPILCNMRLMMFGRKKYIQLSTCAWAQCHWGWDGSWNAKKTQITKPSDLIPAELINAGGRTIFSEIHKPINSIWNKEESPEDWMELFIVPVRKKDDKTDCSNYRVISLLPTMYKILSNVLLWRLTPHAEEIIGVHQCGFWCSRSTTDHTFCIYQIFEKKWEYNEAVL